MILSACAEEPVKEALGSPSFILGEKMKNFTTYDEQIEILKSRNLNIIDEQLLKSQLQEIGYYNLINGYSFVFKYEDCDNYLDNITENEIINLYNYDKHLRDIVYKYALIIESKIKSLISYTFSSKHGSDHKKYLTRDSFDKDINKESKIIKLINDCNELIEECSDRKSKKHRPYISHYVEDHGHVPLWVLIRALTMGQVSKFYSNMKLDEKTEIANVFNIKPSELEIMLKMLVIFRNIVAHDERIFCARINQSTLPYDLKIYDFIQVPRKKENKAPYVGRNDFLSLIIIFKYLLTPTQFKGFWEEFLLERELLTKNLKPHLINKIYYLMGLKNKWKNILNCKI